MEKRNRRFTSLLIGISIVFLIFSNTLFAISVAEVDFEDILQRSDDIIYGVVVDKYSAHGSGRSVDQIFSHIVFSEVESIKKPNGYEKNRFTLRIAGGRVGNMLQVIPGAPDFKVGERYIIFIRDNNKVAFPLVGLNQGVLKVMAEQGGSTHRVLFERPTEKIREHFIRYRVNKFFQSDKKVAQDLVRPRMLMDFLRYRWSGRNANGGSKQ